MIKYVLVRFIVLHCFFESWFVCFFEVFIFCIYVNCKRYSLYLLNINLLFVCNNVIGYCAFVSVQVSRSDDDATTELPPGWEKHEGLLIFCTYESFWAQAVV